MHVRRFSNAGGRCIGGATSSIDSEQAMIDAATSQTAQPVTLEPLDLAALLCSKVCHDVISPVGAIVNGLEVLDENSDAETQEFALALIRKSAQQASARLQFARLAFGAAGSAGAAIDLGDAEQVSKAFLQDDRVQVVWEVPRLLLAKNKVKLLLNMLVIANSSIVRGGTITVGLTDSADKTSITVTARGQNSRLPAHSPMLLAGKSETGSIDPHSIQAHYTGLVARACGMDLEIGHEGDTLTFKANSAA